MKNNINIETSNFFKENNYVLIKNFINNDITNLLYRYVKNQTLRTDYIIYNKKEEYRKNLDGEFTDPQAYGAYSRYGDPMMDTLLECTTSFLKHYTEIEVVPTYSYYRFYQQGNILKRHIDRSSCEISITLCLGYDVSNLDNDYCWPMFVKNKKTNIETPLYLKPGDIIIYRGCEVEHWRDSFLGLNQAQVFLHYNEFNGEYNNLYDGRPILGIPKNF